jgi:cell division protein FtsI (penicillin-binding protein 3)
MKRSKPFSKTRMFFAIAFLALGFGALLSRLVSLQIVQAGELSERAERQREKGIALEAERGTIYDRRGRILATNVEMPSLYAVPSMIDRPRAVSAELARVLKMDPETIRNRIENGKNFVWIKRKVNPALARNVEALGLEGVGFLTESERFYPKRHLLGHLLGFAGLDNHGLEGIELKYDSYLRGEKGWVVVERDAAGRTIFPKGLDYMAPSRGKDIVLTIDEVIQHIAERELDAALKKFSASSGSVIVMDPKTGELLAMAVRPVFNPNSILHHEPEQWRNRAITDTFEPGSTLKAIVAAAALNEGATTRAELFYCENGRMTIGRQVIHDHEKYGYLTFAQVIQKSSNIGMVKVAKRLRPEKIYHYMRAFGFGEKTGIDLGGEASGLLRRPEQWTDYSLASVSIGQEMSATPIQIVTAFAAFANDGWLMQPYLVSEIREPDGTVLMRSEPQARRQAIPSATARALLSIMEGTVRDEGTAAKAALPGYSVSGKTGTAQKIDPKTGRYSARDYISSFVGIVPSDDPRLVILVVLDSPHRERWGGYVAAPVFQKIADPVLRYLGVPPRSTGPLILAAR